MQNKRMQSVCVEELLRHYQPIHSCPLANPTSATVIDKFKVQYDIAGYCVHCTTGLLRSPIIHLVSSRVSHF